MEDPNHTSLLIKVKNVGGLQLPAAGVVNICLKMESFIRENADLVFHRNFLGDALHALENSTAYKVNHSDDHNLTSLISYYYFKIRLHYESSIVSECDKYT